MRLPRPHIRPLRSGFSAPDVLAVALILSIFMGMIVVAAHWVDPLQGSPPISLDFISLPIATFLSVSRILFAYALSLLFAISVGYWAAHSRSAERIIIPMIDILQSIPVLGFLPGVVLFLVGLFPSTRVGLELSAILMIFTGMSWNMTLSFYGSLKSIPKEYAELMRAFRYSRVGTLLRLEIPFALNGLVWNSMLSVAGGWFFLTICESFTLGESSFQLIGLGSYMSLAAERGDGLAIGAGFGIMILLLLLTDKVIWNPLLRWAERFKMASSEENAALEESNVISYFGSSRRITRFVRRLRRYYSSFFYMQPASVERKKKRLRYRAQIYLILSLIVFGFCLWGLSELLFLVLTLPGAEWLVILQDAAWSFLRVFSVLFLCAILMVPVGLWIGSQPQIIRRFQSVIQVAAAFPAPMIFPVLTSALLFLNIPMSVGSVFLMMMGAQWYVLFNVLAGTSTVPREMVDVARTSGFSYVQILRRVHLPASLPQIVTGFLTAAGGAWNTSIVAEIVVFRGEEYIAPGLGSYIAKAAAGEKFAELVAAVTVMVILIILVNRFVWAKLYNLVESRFKI